MDTETRLAPFAKCPWCRVGVEPVRTTPSMTARCSATRTHTELLKTLLRIGFWNSSMVVIGDLAHKTPVGGHRLDEDKYGSYTVHFGYPVEVHCAMSSRYDLLCKVPSELSATRWPQSDSADYLSMVTPEEGKAFVRAQFRNLDVQIVSRTAMCHTLGHPPPTDGWERADGFSLARCMLGWERCRIVLGCSCSLRDSDSV
eukprot:3422142-Amphidinium_carterae.2